MKGLLYNDYMSMQKVLKTSLVIYVLFTIFSLLSDNIIFAVDYTLVFILMVPINIFYSDEKNKWEQYAFTMPVSPKQYVREKYIFFVLTQTIGYVLAYMIVLISYMYNRESFDSTIFDMINVTSAVSGILPVIVIPVMFKYGTEKGRITMLSLLFLPFILVKVLESTSVLTSILQAIQKIALTVEITKVFTETHGVILFIPMIILYLISYAVSLHIYSKKEF